MTLSKIWETIHRLIWARSVCLEAEQPGQPGMSHRVTRTLREPNITMIVIMFLVALGWYFTIGVGTFYVLGPGLTYAHWPATIPVGMNATLRFIMKYKERAAAMAEWPSPIGRQRLRVRMLMVLIGAAAGLFAFQFAEHLVHGGPVSTETLWFSTLAALAEGYLGWARLGGPEGYAQLIETPDVRETRELNV